MRATDLFVGCLFGCLLPNIALSQISYYEVSTTRSVVETEFTDGYANIDWSNPNDIHGTMCLVVRDKTNKIKKTEKLSLQGTNPRAGILEITISEIAPLKPLVFFPEQGGTPLFETEKFVPSWTHLATGDNDVRIDLMRIPKDMDRSFTFHDGDDYYGRGVNGEQKFKLSNYDSLTKEQVLALEARNPPYTFDGGYEPGEVLALVPRTRLHDLRRFLKAEGGGGAFEDPSDEACGAPFVQLDISVPPLLELYYARKLQVSGLVVTAYPVSIGAGVGFDSIGVRDKRIVQLISSADVELKQKDEELWTMILGNVRAFVEARRPDFREKGTIARLQRGGGQVLVYRMEIEGPAITECTRNLWEKVVLQVIPATTATDPSHVRDELPLLFQFQEGFFAPGSLDRRPDDARINENRIPDGRLEGLQERLYGFLVTRGFSKDQSTAINSDVACKL
jgi:hypothetical protein